MIIFLYLHASQNKIETRIALYNQQQHNEQLLDLRNMTNWGFIAYILEGEFKLQQIERGELNFDFNQRESAFSLFMEELISIFKKYFPFNYSKPPVVNLAFNGLGFIWTGHILLLFNLTQEEPFCIACDKQVSIKRGLIGNLEVFKSLLVIRYGDLTFKKSNSKNSSFKENRKMFRSLGQKSELLEIQNLDSKQTIKDLKDYFIKLKSRTKEIEKLKAIEESRSSSLEVGFWVGWCVFVIFFIKLIKSIPPTELLKNH